MCFRHLEDLHYDVVSLHSFFLYLALSSTPAAQDRHRAFGPNLAGEADEAVLCGTVTEVEREVALCAAQPTNTGREMAKWGDRRMWKDLIGCCHQRVTNE